VNNGCKLMPRTAEKQREWRLKNPEKSKAIAKKCYENHKEEISEKRKGYSTEHYRANSERLNEQRKEHLHKIGIRKRYNKMLGISRTPEYRKQYNQRRKSLLRSVDGELSVETIGRVYDVNVKVFGVLTCYLCFDTIGDNISHLEHKTPLTRGGTNLKDNLDVACASCNCSKGNKTLSEYLGYTVLKPSETQSNGK